MYTLIKKNDGTAQITYKTPCGRVAKVAGVIDIGTKDERVVFLAQIVAGNTVKEVAKLLEANK